MSILTSDVLVPAYGAYENLVVSSVGLKRFKLFGPSSSSSAGMSSLGCVISFFRYLVLKLVISALTVGICRSVCGIVFGTYRGALTIDLRTLFSNLCSISMLELLAVPQRGVPYVQMGFRTVLYIRILFYSHSFDFLPMIQYMRWSCNPRCFLVVKSSWINNFFSSITHYSQMQYNCLPPLIL